jgi:hypothetical protein
MKNQNLITQLLSPYIEQFAQNVAPKASDVMNKIISDHDKSMKEFNLQREKLPIDENQILGMVMGLSGGVKGLGALRQIPQYVKSIQHGAGFLDKLMSSK